MRNKRTRLAVGLGLCLDLPLRVVGLHSRYTQAVRARDGMSPGSWTLLVCEPFQT